MKQVLLRLHGLLGITAGLVLAVVGLTGALLALEPQILKVLNPGILVVEERAQPRLSPAELVRRLRELQPERHIRSVTVTTGDAPAAVVFAIADKPKGEMRHVDPYSGLVLSKPRGDDVFHVIEDIHRRLLADKVGRQVTGACALVLVFMALSGLYLRWSRRPRGWRGWLLVNGRLSGRGLLWQLHAVSGTWVLAIFLFSALTGLFWSYDWYKSGVQRLFGAEVSVEQKKKPAADGLSDADMQAVLQVVWTVFQTSVPAYDSATIDLPRQSGKPVKVSYVAPGAVHERARDTLLINTEAGGRVVKQEMFAHKPWGQRMVASWKQLHTGQYWGVTGQLVLMLASFSMLLFAYTGWRLYFGRRAMSVRPGGVESPAPRPQHASQGAVLPMPGSPELDANV